MPSLENCWDAKRMVWGKVWTVSDFGRVACSMGAIMQFHSFFVKLIASIGYSIVLRIFVLKACQDLSGERELVQI